MTFGMIGTVACAALVLFLGYRVRSLVPPLDRFNIPAPMVGIILGSLIGAPIVTLLIRRHRLKPTPAIAASASATTTLTAPDDGAGASSASPPSAGGDVYVALQSVAVILVAMWAGGAISGWIERGGVTMPAYIGAMLVAGALRNIDDATGWLKLPHRSIDTIGNVALALFLVMALMNLNLLTLAGLAQPLLVTLLVQLAIVVGVCFWPLYRLMGRDYDAAVMCGGFAGFITLSINLLG